MHLKCSFWCCVVACSLNEWWNQMLLWLRTLLTISFPLRRLRQQTLLCLSMKLIIFPLSLLKLKSSLHICSDVIQQNVRYVQQYQLWSTSEAYHNCLEIFLCHQQGASICLIFCITLLDFRFVYWLLLNFSLWSQSVFLYAPCPHSFLTTNKWNFHTAGLC